MERSLEMAVTWWGSDQKLYVKSGLVEAYWIDKKILFLRFSDGTEAKCFAMDSNLMLTYFGCFIWRNTEPGYRLRYSALTPSGPVAADTLAGIKQLIKEALKK